MKTTTFISALALCVLLAAPAFAQEVIPPTTATKPAAVKPAAGTASKAVSSAKTFGDWKMECPKGTCLLSQRVMATGKGGKQVPGIIAIGGTSTLKSKDGKAVKVPYVRLISPLGAFLPKGVEYKLDEGKNGNTPFLFCEPTGCMAEMTMTPDQFEKLKNGKKLQVSYSTLDTKAPRKVSVSLNGFAQGMAALQR
jgi:invasion protein IalB